MYQHEDEEFLFEDITKMLIRKQQLYEAVDAQPELVGSDYTERLWKHLYELISRDSTTTRVG